MDFVPLLASVSAAFDPSLMRSVDGHMLPIDEVKGIKPVESINLTGKKRKIGVAPAVIIAACIRENAVLKELKYAALHAQER